MNPLLSPKFIGPPFINLALLGYGIPALLAIILALVARTTRPMAYRAVAAGTAVVLSLMYLTVQIARLFQGPMLTAGPSQRRAAIRLLGDVARVWRHPARRRIVAAVKTRTHRLQAR